MAREVEKWEGGKGASVVAFGGNYSRQANYWDASSRTSISQSVSVLPLRTATTR